MQKTRGRSQLAARPSGEAGQNSRTASTAAKPRRREAGGRARKPRERRQRGSAGQTVSGEANAARDLLCAAAGGVQGPLMGPAESG